MVDELHVDPRLEKAVKHLTKESDKVREALTNAHCSQPQTEFKGESPMDPVAALITQIQAVDTVLGSAATFINGVPLLITNAVNAAIAGGATAAQLAPLTALAAQLTTDSQTVLQAIATNTPSPAPTPQQLKVAKGK